MSVSAVPEIWKMAIVTPVLKKGPATDLANYRSISLTCVAGKIMERIIVNQMTCFFLDTGVINKAQHGFLKGLSTATNLIGLYLYKCKKNCSLSTTYNGEMTHRKQQK